MKIFFRKGGRGRGHPPVSPGGGRGGWPPACISAGPVPGGNTSSAAYLQNAPCQRAPTDRHLAGAPAAKLPPSHPPTFPVSADVMVPPARVDKCPRPPLFPVSPGRCGCPRPRLLVRRGEGRFPCTVPRRPALPVLPCALPHPHASHSLCTFPAPPRASPHSPCSPAPSLTHTPPTPSAPPLHLPCTAPHPPRRPALPTPPRASLRPPSPTRLPLPLHLPLHRPAPPTPPFPAPVPTPSPRHLPPLPANLPKPSDPRHIFFSFFYIFCHNFGDSAPEIPKSASLFCVFMQFDQNIRKNKALFQGLTLHFFLYFPGFYVVLLVLISCHGEIKKKRV